MSVALLALAVLVGCPRTTDSDLVGQLDREIIALRGRNEQLKQQLQSCSEGELDTAIYAELTQVFSGSEVQVSREGARAIVVIPGSLLFSAGSTDIREEALMVLDLFSVALKLHSEMHVWVIGHTDDDPLTGQLKRRFGDNWGLSTARAWSFMNTMSVDFGIEPSRFTIAGQGSSQPIATNDTDEGRARNRRIVLVIGPARALP